MNQPWYIGSAAYCYANSTAMLLASIGETIAPAVIEVLTGVGLSASARLPDGETFFNYQPLYPDLGIHKALDILGFTYQSYVCESAADDPTHALTDALREGGAVIGPLDMGALPYHPRRPDFHADHFIYAYAMQGPLLQIHDPGGFPHVLSAIEDLREAWQAEAVEYRQGYYRFLSRPRRVRRPDAQEISQAALEHFAALYQGCAAPETRQRWVMGEEAIDRLAGRVSTGALSDGETGFLLGFALPLGARRADDFARFFQQHDPHLSSLKAEQARLFGAARTWLAMARAGECAQALRRLGQVEAQIRGHITGAGSEGRAL